VSVSPESQHINARDAENIDLADIGDASPRGIRVYQYREERLYFYLNRRSKFLTERRQNDGNVQ